MKHLALMTIAAALVAPAVWADTIATNPANAPKGTHLQSGAPGCTDSNLIVSCAGFTLGGVGNTNLTVTLSVTYSGTVLCTNSGGNVAPGQTKYPTLSEGPQTFPSKNGQITIPPMTTNEISLDEIKAALMANTKCPNTKWTKSVQDGSVQLVGWSETLLFANYKGNYMVISG